MEVYPTPHNVDFYDHDENDYTFDELQDAYDDLMFEFEERISKYENIIRKLKIENENLIKARIELDNNMKGMQNEIDLLKKK
ncbi:Uncharacterized protein TCM_003246 [Theobroma cacao]|uniref:Uncharacterized protein n=1 Tax=Theobroma cacao TaxID=3641 RepID=A0A061DVR8_THECC|nr:Uncharacterized protein TCM_003246 [Theobroma cacao]